MVEISVGRIGELEGSHANIVKSLVVDTEGLVRVLNQLMDRESSVIWLHNGIGDLGGSVHHAANRTVCRSDGVENKTTMIHNYMPIECSGCSPCEFVYESGIAIRDAIAKFLFQAACCRTKTLRSVFSPCLGARA